MIGNPSCAGGMGLLAARVIATVANRITMTAGRRRRASAVPAEPGTADADTSDTESSAANERWRSGTDVTDLSAWRGGDPGAWRRGLVFYEGAGTAPVAGVAGGGGACSRLPVRVREMPVVSGAQM
jgi:hypothetical protein